jgi:hypothetical protein
MSTRKQQLNSELPFDKLLQLSKSVAVDRFNKYYFILKSDSLLLNPNRRNAGANHMIDITGLRGMLENYTHARMEGDVPLGMVKNREWQLRQLWRRHEYLLKCNGTADLTSLPSGNVAEDIACQAVNFQVVLEELVKIRQTIEKHDAKQEETIKSTRKRNGACKRGGAPDYKIIQADGMAVDEKGIITEIGQHVGAYLAEIKTEKARQRTELLETREAAQAAA